MFCLPGLWAELTREFSFECKIWSADILYYFTSYRQECVHAPNINTAAHIHGSCRSCWSTGALLSTAHHKIRCYWRRGTYNMHWEHTPTSAWGSCAGCGVKVQIAVQISKEPVNQLYIMRQCLFIGSFIRCSLWTGFWGERHKKARIWDWLDNESANHEYASGFIWTASLFCLLLNPKGRCGRTIRDWLNKQTGRDFKGSQY